MSDSTSNQNPDQTPANEPAPQPRSMPLPIFGGVAIFGGPYWLKPEGLTGVKMAVELELPCDIAIDTRDYSVPTQAAMQAGVLAAVERLHNGETLYAGCWGGVGRTGLFMACLAKAAGVREPIRWVRGHYNEHAVETREQAAFVDAFESGPAQEKIQSLGGFPAQAADGEKPRRRGVLGFGRG